MKTCLVTGGAGFIGSHLVRALLARGDPVRVLDNFSTGKRENLAGLQSPLEVIEGDLRDAHIVAAALRGVDVVFHQAAYVSVPGSMEDPQTCFDTNVRGTATLLEAARQAGVNQVVIASSAAVYGDTVELPVQENMPPNPLSPYALSKQVNELYARLYSRVFALPVIALRYFNVFGPRQSAESQYAAAIPIFIDQMLNDRAPIIYGDGHQGRDFIYVEDVVRANLIAADCPQAGGLALNVCTGRETNLLELTHILREVMQSPIQADFAPPRPGDIYRSYGDPRLGDQTLGFQAQISLAEGLTRTVDWMRS